MKSISVPSPLLLRRLRRTLPLGDPRIRAAAAGGAALLLAAFELGGQSLPLSAALLLALPTGQLLPAAAGGLAGELLFRGWPGALEGLALRLLFLTAAGLFRSELRALPLLGAALAAGISTLLGLVFLLDRGFSLTTVAVFLVKPPLAALTVLAVPLLRGTAPVRRETALRDVRSEAEQPLRRISGVFAMMHGELAGPAPQAAQNELADSYDSAAEQVCRMCVRHRLCWEADAQRTYEALCAAGAPIAQRGCAVREDFPESFRAGCCHMEGFLTAVNQALEANRCRRQLRNRLHEGRRVLASQYLFLSRFLGRLADDVRRPPQAEARYVPEFAASSACRPGSRISGDRGATFQDRWNHYYVLLCDGMGSGAEAARESERAVRTLTGLLESGVAPDAAMELLNGFYMLQESTVFSTVDLLQLDLASGAGVLYKWGAAPSYLKHGDCVQTLGTATPPPGLSMEPAQTPCQLSLSLCDGETLIMVSDGVFCEQTLQRATRFSGSGCRELAGYLIAGLRDRSEDDLTAAVLRLSPVGAAAPKTA